MTGPLLSVDVAHPPLPPDEVERALDDAVSLLRNQPGHTVLKIIHGYGSSGRGGKTREVVHNWTYRNRSRFRAVINGEEYTIFHEAVQRMKTEVEGFDDPDLMTSNPGITVCWVR